MRIIPSIPIDVPWTQDGVTVAGGNGKGNNVNQLQFPGGLFVDGEVIVIADKNNHRIVQWERNGTQGQVVAGGNGNGNRLDQLNWPTDVAIDKKTDSLIICDRENRRVVRWSRRSGTKQGEILIDNIDCRGLAIDDQGYFYVSDEMKHEVRRYRPDDKKGTLVAGGNGQGHGLHQLNYPRYLFVDSQQNLYVSDYFNQRVMKWNQNAKEGIVLTGSQELDGPQGIFVDTLGTLYLVDTCHHRVIRWSQGSLEGTVIFGGNGEGDGINQLSSPAGLSFDQQGNLYVADSSNHRIQRFSFK